MHFSEATGAPVILDTGSRKIAVPRFGLKDFSLWAAEIDAAKQAEHEKNLESVSTDPERRFHFRTAYGTLKASIDECRGLVRTPPGITRVIDTCFPRARVIERDGQRVDEPLPPDEIERLKEANDDQLPELAWVLAGPRKQPTAGQNGDNGKADKTADPLARGGTPADATQPATGTPTSAPT